MSGTQHVIFSIGHAMQRLGYHILNTVTWYKPNASPNLSCRYFTHSTELLIWASPSLKKPLAHRFEYAAMKAENGGKQMRDVWALPTSADGELADDAQGRVWTLTAPGKNEKKFGRHPTQKPEQLLRRILRASAGEGCAVLDPFCGSGTTGAVALKNGMRFVGIDADVSYLDVCRRRFSDVASTPPVVHRAS